MNNKALIAVIVLIGLAAIGFLFYSSDGVDKRASLLTALAATTYTLAFIWSVRVLSNQLEATRRATYSQAFVVASGILNAKEVIFARDKVRRLRNVPVGNRFNGNEELDGRAISRRDCAGRVCQTFDDVALMVRFGMLPPEIVEHTWGSEMAAQWIVLREFVETERANQGNANLWREFQNLATLPV
jgi:hypothetical protein